MKRIVAVAVTVVASGALAAALAGGTGVYYHTTPQAASGGTPVYYHT